MAIGDAGKLGEAISKHEGNLEAALEEYQQERMAQTAKEVRPYATMILYVPAVLPLLLHQLNTAMPCRQCAALDCAALKCAVLKCAALNICLDVMMFAQTAEAQIAAQAAEAMH